MPFEPESVDLVGQSLAHRAPPRRFLVCLDDSPRAPEVLDAAIDLAWRAGARLTLLHSLHPDAPAKVAEDFLRLGDNLVPSVLLEAVRAHTGRPWRAICREAETLHPDLIIIGSHGFRGLDHLLGTTATRVVNHANCSVLVIR
jgi:nucleotide-binding universal stress UspA family protein